METLRLLFADVYQDSDVLKEASEMVDEVLEADPALLYSGKQNTEKENG